ncbi:hypothetical protein [Aliikangiella coralliicola]|uniref:Lipoprotein n=1 Tax=Aliikangiella coralliicola TaxID=2592383 RepID=A0A545UEI2_9GAMM|nr:hypothetical protein [Aliikangiella coralliicola]TQV87868.1 hypothetical protein FLL46_10845 [Aliikangiella coralliicola]
MRKVSYFGLFLLTMTLLGCKKTMLVQDYPGQQIPHYAQEKSTVESVEKAIMRAAISLGWKTEVIEKGKILATLNIRKHQLVVDITHDDKSYSIKYKDSVNLKYDGKKIHRQYGNWVKNLINSINAFSVSD